MSASASGCMALEDEGYEVRGASSGEDGVEAMRASPADFVIRLPEAV